MGKKILIGFTILLIFGLLAGWYFFTREAKYFGTSAFRAIPKNCSVILRVHHVGNYVSKSLKNPVWKGCSALPGVKDLYQELVFADSMCKSNPELKDLFFDKDLTISFGSKKDSLDNLVIFELSSLGEKRTLSGIAESYFLRKGAVFDQVGNGDARISLYSWKEGTRKHQFLMSFYRGLLISSTDLNTIIKSIDQLNQPDVKVNSVFEKANKTTTDNIDINIYLNHNKLAQFFPDYASQDVTIQLNGSSTAAEWSEIDLTQKDGEFLLNGFIFTGDSMNNYLEIFLHQHPAAFNLSGVFPAETSFFLTYMISDNKQFFRDYESLLDHQHELDRYKNSLREIDSLYHSDIQKIVINNLDGAAAIVFTRPDLSNRYENKFLVLRVNSGMAVEDAMTPLIEPTQNKGKGSLAKNGELYKIDNETVFRIYKTRVSDFGKRVFGEPFAGISTNFFTIYDNCLIMGPSYESLCRFLKADILQETLGNNLVYQEFAAGLSDRLNLYTWASPGKSYQFIKGMIDSTLYRKLDGQRAVINKIESLGWQVVIENGMAYNMARLKYNPELKEISSSPSWRSLIGSPLITKLQLVTNPDDKTRQEIVVQDSTFNFSLIGNQGRVLWKIKLDSPINSEIFQLNCFKDGKLQFFFSTKDALHMIDHDGNYIRNFPLGLRSPATNGVSVFDYDKNSTYRFFIAGKDHHVYLYDKTGKTVPDWAPQKTEHEITQPIQYFRTDGKDYLVFSDRNRGYILDRKGKPRVMIKGDIRFSHNNRFFLEPKSGKIPARLVTTDSEGSVVLIGFDGSIKKLPTGPFSEDHFFIYQDLDSDKNEDYIFLDGTSYVIYDRKGNKTLNRKLNFSVVSEPGFYIFPDNSRKIGITLSSENRIYLFNSDGSVDRGFPLEGNSPFVIGFSKVKPYSINLIAGTRDGYLNNYKIK